MKKSWSNMRPWLFLFIVHLCLSSVYLDSWRNPNTTSRVLQIMSLHERGTLYIDGREDQTLDKALVNDHYYPLQPPMPSLMVWPVFEAMNALGLSPDGEERQMNFIFRFGAFLCGSLPFALLLVLITLHCVESGMGFNRASLLTALPMYGSMFFIYAGTFYSHLLVVFCIVLAFRLIRNSDWYFIAGLLCGMAFFSEYLTAVIFAAWFFLLLYHRSAKGAILYAVGLIPFIVGFIAYNQMTTGHALLTPYSYNLAYDMEQVGFSYPSFQSLFSMFFLPRRGAFFYFPVLSLLVYNFWTNKKSLARVPWSGFLIIPSALFILVLSSYQEWHGGWTFGPRYLFPVLALLIYSGLPLTGKGLMSAFFFWIPVIFGLGYAFLAKFTVIYSVPSKFVYPLVQYIIPKWQEGAFNEGNIFSLCFDMAPLYGAGIFTVVFAAAMFLISRIKWKTVQ